MILPFVTKLLSAIGFYYAAIFFVRPLGKYAPLFSALAVACTACGAVSCRLRKINALRAIAGLMPFAMLLFAPSVSLGVLMALPCIYTATVCIGGMFRVDRWNYTSHYRWTCLVMAVYQVGILAADRQNPAVICFGVLYFLAGAFTLRQSRIGEGTDASQRLLDTAELSVPVAASLLIATLVMLTRSYLSKVVEVLLFPISWPISLLIWLLARIPMEEVAVQPTPTPKTSPLPQIGMKGGLPSVPTKEMLVPADATWLKRTTVIILVCVGIALVIYCVTMALKHRDDLSPNRVDLYGGSLTREKDDADARTRSRGDKGAARRIRRIYAQYLKVLREHGHFVFPSDTSQEIYERTEEHCVETDSSREMRELYIRARYRTEEPLSEADVRRAKTMLKEIQKAIRY